MKIDALRKQLDSLNGNIAARMGRQPVALSHQIGDTQKDPLFLYGIVGGKDVGKTVLINQLAGTTISLRAKRVTMSAEGSVSDILVNLF